MKSLLLGNGINRKYSNKFSNESIIKRLKKTIESYSNVKIFNLNKGYEYNKTLLEHFVFNDDVYNIEDVMFDMFVLLNNIYNENNNKLVIMSVVEYLKELIITAIFFDKQTFINIKKQMLNDNDLIKTFKNYDNIFSLNYYEYWDVQDTTKYLHDRIYLYDIEKYRKTLETIVIDPIDIEFMSMEIENFPIYNLDNLIMIPPRINYNKESYINEFGRYIFINNVLLEKENFKEVKLYGSLEKVDELHIFGVSPYNDSLLIESLKTVVKIVIYIFDINNSPEYNVWKNLLPNAIYLDSSLFVI